MVKRGDASDVIGPVPRAVLLLRAKDYLARREWPSSLATAAGVVSDAVLEAWRRIVLHGHPDFAVEEVRRFDSSFDDVTHRGMAWHGFWSPHDADFLNWRRDGARCGARSPALLGTAAMASLALFPLRRVLSNIIPDVSLDGRAGPCGGQRARHVATGPGRHGQPLVASLGGLGAFWHRRRRRCFHGDTARPHDPARKRPGEEH